MDQGEPPVVGESLRTGNTEPAVPVVPVVWVRPLATLFVCAAAVAIGIVLFKPISTVLLGILAAAIVASTLNPLIKYMPGSRGVSAAVLGLGLIALVGGIFLALSWPLAGPIQQEVKEWPQTHKRVDALLTKWTADLQLKEPMTVDSLMNGIGQFFTGETGSRLFSGTADVVFAILIWLVFIFVGSIFMLADPSDSLVRPGLHFVAPRFRARIADLLSSLAPRLRRWVIGTFISMCIVFAASWVGYTFIRMDFALPLAMLAGLAEIVPTVGPACAVLVALLFAATQSGGTVVGVLAIYAGIQSIEAYIILPMIMRGAVKIQPAVTLFSVVLWGKLFGVPGLMLAIPINLTIAAMLEHLYVRPRDGVLAGRLV